MTQDTQVPTTDKELLRVLVDQRIALQKLRIAQNNRIEAIERGVDVVDDPTYETIKRLYHRFYVLEKEIDDEIEAIVSKLFIYQRMVRVKGIGPSLSAQIVSMIDISLTDHVSALWKWCGLGVTDGEADRRRKGEKVAYNPFLKAVLLQKVGSSFLKARSPYAAVYYEAKDEYTRRTAEAKDHLQVLLSKQERDGLAEEIAQVEKIAKRSALHIHNMARRKMVKLFVSHLWQVWREIEGLPTPEPYAHAHLGHVDMILPEEMGW